MRACAAPLPLLLCLGEAARNHTSHARNYTSTHVKNRTWAIDEPHPHPRAHKMGDPAKLTMAADHHVRREHTASRASRAVNLALETSSRAAPEVPHGLTLHVFLSSIALPVTIALCWILREACGLRWPAFATKRPPADDDGPGYLFIGCLIVGYFFLNVGLSMLQRCVPAARFRVAPSAPHPARMAIGGEWASMASNSQFWSPART